MKANNLEGFSGETILGHLIYLLKLPNQDFMVRARKRCGLLMLGVSKEVVEELCKETEPDIMASIRQVRLRVERERRELERERLRDRMSKCGK